MSHQKGWAAVLEANAELNLARRSGAERSLCPRCRRKDTLRVELAERDLIQALDALNFAAVTPADVKRLAQ